MITEKEKVINSVIEKCKQITENSNQTTKKYNKITEIFGQLPENFDLQIEKYVGTISNIDLNIIKKLINKHDCDAKIIYNEKIETDYLNIYDLEIENFKIIKLIGVEYRCTIVSVKDYNMLSQYKWYLNSNGNVINENNVAIHDLLMAPPNGYVVHHKNFNKFDNRWTNLEILDYKKIQLSKKDDEDKQIVIEDIKINNACVSFEDKLIVVKNNKINEVCVSFEDYEVLSKRKWHLNGDGYAVNGKKELMHRIIMEPQGKLVTNHKDTNKLNNTRVNLENITIAENAAIRSKKETESGSKYINVTFHKKKNRYVTRATVDGVLTYIGDYDKDKEIDAAIAYDMFVIYNNLKKHLNFPYIKNMYLNTLYFINVKKMPKSKYYGVSLDTSSLERNKKNSKYPIIYIGRVYHDGKNNKVYVGNNEISCAKACDARIIKKNLPGRKLNFKEDYPNYDPKQIKTLCEPFEGIINESIKGEEFIKYENNVVRLLIETAKDKIVLIDKEDYEIIKYYGCCVDKFGYVRVTNYNGKLVALHRLLKKDELLLSPDMMVVDHIYGNTLDNRKNLLRVITLGQNSQNRRRNPNANNEYTGVTLEGIIWKSKIGFNNNNIHLGSFDNQEDAARMRDLYILEKLKDEYYNLAFIWTVEEIEFWEKKLEINRRTKTKKTSDEKLEVKN